MFYRLQSIIYWFFQVIGLVMALAGSFSAIVWATQGLFGDALIAGLCALGGIGAVAAGGWMRKAAKKERDFFGF